MVESFTFQFEAAVTRWFVLGLSILKQATVVSDGLVGPAFAGVFGALGGSAARATPTTPDRLRTTRTRIRIPERMERLPSLGRFERAGAFAPGRRAGG